MSKHQTPAQASSHLQESHKREQAFLERAQAGEDIRDEAVLSLKPTIERMASRLYARLSPQSRVQAVEMHDLEQEAYARMLALFPKSLQQKEPFRWLCGTAYGAMRDQLNGPGDAIKRQPRDKPIPVLRLDRPLTDDGATLADILPDSLRSSPHLPEYTRAMIEQAIGTLPEKQRLIILLHFGFTGVPVSLNQIGRDVHSHHVRPHSTYQYKKALGTLRQALSDIFPHQSKQSTQAIAAGGIRS
jgi:DNA-directed RNA polymerase specialized sigma24 family protein